MSIAGINVNNFMLDLMEILERIAVALERLADQKEEDTE